MKDPNLRMTTVYPKHEFDSEDMLKSLRELGLVPNASIIISPVTFIFLCFLILKKFLFCFGI